MLSKTNWQSSVNKWRMIINLIENKELRKIKSIVLNGRCGFCEEFDYSESDNPCEGCPLSSQEHCYYDRDEKDNITLWEFLDFCKEGKPYQAMHYALKIFIAIRNNPYYEDKDES